ncbi:hypothetical protein I4U23_005408 [Adineta vaga]|nr:hypothetical protein I4U23_005408 [Adineta vaga]
MSDPERYLNEINAGTFGQNAEINNIELPSHEDHSTTNDMNLSRTDDQIKQLNQDTCTHGSSVLCTFNQKTSSNDKHLPAISPFVQYSKPICVDQWAEKLLTKTGLDNSPMRQNANEYTTQLSKNTGDKEPVIETTNKQERDCLVIEVFGNVPFKLLEVHADKVPIPLNSLPFQHKMSLDNKNFQLRINKKSKNKWNTYVLRIQAEPQPCTTWNCIVTNKKKISCTIEKERRIDEHTNRRMTTSSYVHNPFVVNILLIGRSQVGKSTLIEALRDPDYSTPRTGISQTHEPSYKQLIMTSKNGDKYTLNIIDTPGLHEIRQDPNETRTDQQLLTLLRDICVNGKIRALNTICFVSVMGKTYQNDIDTFKSLIDFFGERFKSISALVLTHCDKISTDRLQQLTDNIKTHPKCSDVVDYCRLGVYHNGTLDVDDLDTYDEELRERVRISTLDRLEPMRTKLTEFLLSQSCNYIEISENDFQRFEKLVKGTEKSNGILETGFEKAKEEALSNSFICYCNIL